MGIVGGGKKVCHEVQLFLQYHRRVYGEALCLGGKVWDRSFGVMQFIHTLPGSAEGFLAGQLSKVDKFFGPDFCRSFVGSVCSPLLIDVKFPK